MLQGDTGEFPTPVGMNRAVPDAKGRCNRVPHARGDEPLAGLIQEVGVASSPRPWG